jgi:hypothetical protein
VQFLSNIIKHHFFRFVNLLLILSLVISCDSITGENDDDDDDFELMSSTHSSMESHNAGQNCMNCHNSGGNGEGIFEIAGTVYEEGTSDVFPNVNIEFYSELNGGGNLLKTLEVDGRGNFYTTDIFDFNSGIYPLVTDGINQNHMTQIANSGSCNSCHGNSVSNIFLGGE